MKLLLVVICSLFFVSFVSVAIAQESERKYDVINVSVTITQKDNDGNLITYLEFDNANWINPGGIDMLLDGIATDYDPIFTLTGKDGEIYAKVQTVTRQTPLSTDPSGLLSTLQYFIVDSNGQKTIVAEFNHDGLRLNDDESVYVLWTFMRYV